MITPYQILQEAGFAQHTAMVRFHYNRENTSLGAEKIAEMVRAIPGATRVSTVSLDKQHGIGIFNVKIISSKPPKEAFQLLKRNALERYQGLIVGVEVGANTIETKGEFIIKEEKNPLKPTNLGNYIGTLLEEGLLLEISIEELRRQYVECDPPKLTAEVFEQIVQACNNRSNFATWMCKKVATGIVQTEDLQLWTEIFTFFERYKQRFQKKDINQVKSREDVHNFIDDYNRVRDEVEAKKATGQTQKAKDETDQCLLGKLKSSDGKRWLAYKVNPGQWQFERKIGSGTSWCTVASEHYFNYYMGPRGNNDQAYYIFINMNDPKEKYQIHYGSNQCKDKEDTEVDYSQDFVVDFYRYLEEVDHRTQWPPQAIKGRAKNEFRKASEESLDQQPNQLDNLPHKSFDSGTIYRFPKANTGNIEPITWAVFFRDLGCPTKEAVLRAEEYLEAENLNKREVIVIKFKGGDWDLVASNYENILCSYVGQSNGADLPKCSTSNFELYKEAAKLCNATIKDEVAVKCNPNLPDISHFEIKSEGNRKLYKFEPRDRSETIKALYQTGMYRHQIIEYSNYTIYAYTGPEIQHDIPYVTFTDNEWIRHPGIQGTGLDAVEKRLAILKFAEIDLEHANYSDAAVYRLNKVGGKEGLLNNLRSSVVEQPEGLPQEYCAGRSQALGTLLLSDGGEVAFLCQRLGNEVPESIITSRGGKIENYKFSNNIVHPREITTQREVIDTNIPLGILVRFCQFVPVEVPAALEKLYARSRGIYGSTPNVTKILRDQRERFQDYEIPYVRNYRRTSVYREIGRGVYGTWAQLGPAIRESCPTYYPRFANAIQAHPGCTVDVFLHYNRDSATRSWNGIIRVIDQQNKVVWYARRYGNGMGLQWSIRDDIEPDLQVDASGFESNYVAPQPPAPRPVRQPRQARQAAQPAAPAQPLPDRTPEVEQVLNQCRVNSGNADEAYQFNGENYVQALNALGFSNLASSIPDNMEIQRVFIYRCYAHKGGQTSHVAIIDPAGQNTIVAGYPANPTLQIAQSHSTRWRALTQELDNSTRTFQQCVDFCQEQHIPLPIALQGWLVYRGANRQ